MVDNLLQIVFFHGICAMSRFILLLAIVVQLCLSVCLFVLCTCLCILFITTFVVNKRIHYVFTLLLKSRFNSPVPCILWPLNCYWLLTFIAIFSYLNQPLSCNNSHCAILTFGINTNQCALCFRSMLWLSQNHRTRDSHGECGWWAWPSPSLTTVSEPSSRTPFRCVCATCHRRTEVQIQLQ